MQAQMGLMSVPTSADASGQIQQQIVNMQQMSRFISPPPMMMGGISPVRRPTGLEQAFNFPRIDLPGPQFGGPMAMARQRTIGGMNELMGGAQAGFGTAARVAAGVGIGMIPGIGLPLSMAFEASGMGQGLQQGVSSLFNPMINQRARMLEIQNMSTRFMRGAGPDISSAGGLTAQAAQRLSSQLMNMADDPTFQQATGRRFNREDVMKITRLSGQLGMLDQDQSADDIRRSVSKISKALSNFMKIAEEPDVQAAMQTMGRMRAMGMDVAQTNLAVGNARLFARMAGVNVNQVIQQGMPGAQIYQQAGLTGGAGLQAGMAAAGWSGMAQTRMTPQQLALAGGRQGIQQTLTQASAGMGRMDLLMPALANVVGGKMEIDPQQFTRFMSGRMSLNEMLQRGSNMATRLGPRGMQELLGQRREFMDEMQQRMGGQAQMMMPFIMMRNVMRQHPGIGTYGAAEMVARHTGADPRTLQRIAEDPRTWEDMMRQTRERQREVRYEVGAARRETIEEGERGWLDVIGEERARGVRGFFGGMGRGITRFGEELGQDLAAWQDVREAAEAEGEGFIRMARPAQFAGERMRRLVRERSRQGGTVDLGGMMGVDIGTRVGGGLTEREFTLENVSLMRELELTLPGGPGTGDAIRREAADQRSLGRMVERARRARRDVRFDDTMRGAAQEATPAVSKEKFDAAVNDAAFAINKYLRSTRNILLPDETPNKAEMKKHLRQALKDKGYKDEQINQMVTDEFVQNAITAGADWRTELEKGALAEVEEIGGGSAALLRVGKIDAIREEATKQRETIFKAIGLDLEGEGDWDWAGGYDISAEEGERFATQLTGDKAEDKLRRLLLAQQAVTTYINEGNVEDPEEARATLGRLGTQIRALRRQVGDAGVARAEAGVATASMGVDAKVALGKHLSKGGKSAEQIDSDLKEAGEQTVSKAQQKATAIGFVRMLGGEVSPSVGRGTAEDFKEVQRRIKETGIQVDKDVQADIDAAARGEGGAISRLQRRATQLGLETRPDVAGGGERQIKTGAEGMMERLITGMQEFFVGDREKTGKAVAATSFEGAVSEFSIAAQEMQEAAKTLQGDRDTSLISKAIELAIPTGLIPGWGGD